MAAAANQAAWLIKADSTLQVGNAPMSTAGTGELVVKNAAIAINPLDWHIQDSGVFVQQWPTILGCDVAGEVYEVGPDVQQFKKGDHVIGHAVNLVSGRPCDGAFALYTVIPADNAAILPDGVFFTDGVVVPFALEAAACALSLKVPGVAMPGVPTPALSLPYPSLQRPAPTSDKTLVVYGGSSSVGSMATQLDTAAGIHVISIAGAHNFDLSKRCGAAQVFDHKDSSVADKVVKTVDQSGQHEFVGIFDAIGTPETYAYDLAILAKLGGGQLARVHPPPADVPANVKADMIFAIDDVVTPVWKHYVTPRTAERKSPVPSPTYHRW